METAYQTIHHLSRIKKRFQDYPLAVLAVHDASLTTLAEFEKALAPLRDQIAGDNSVRLLLDLPPIGEGRARRPAAARTAREGPADIYEGMGGPMFVIDKSGKLVLAVSNDLTEVVTFTLDKNGKLVRDSGELSVTEDDKVDREFAWASVEGALEDQFGLPQVLEAKVVRQPWGIADGWPAHRQGKGR